MYNRTHTKNMFKATAWIIGIAVVFVLLSAGLEFFVRQTVDQTSFPTILELLYVAFWSYAVGVVLLMVAPVWLFVSWIRAWVKQYALNMRTQVEAQSRRLEDSALDGHDVTTEAGAGFPEPPSGSRAGSGQARELTQVA